MSSNEITAKEIDDDDCSEMNQEDPIHPNDENNSNCDNENDNDNATW